MKIDTHALKSFILEASRATYASGDAAIKEKMSDGSTALVYESGEYRFHDNYFGGEPYGGREVVFLNTKPIWMMVYYGQVYQQIETKDIYSFLMESLSNAPLEMPYRGPSFFENGLFKYENSFSGNIERFSGVEKIYKDTICVYEAGYRGGFVDIHP